jgi:hypothetical protein
MREGQPTGACHGVPPTPLIVGGIKHPVTLEIVPNVQSFWPIVQETHFCLRFERRLPNVEDLERLELVAAEGEA